jgi:transposase-like protein
MKNVDGPAVRLVDDTETALAQMPSELAVTLVDIAVACREGLMAVAVEAGLATATAIMAEEAAGLCGAWNARDPQRAHVRGGTTATSVVMGGQRLPIRRPRVRATDGSGEVPLESFGVFAQGDLLNATVMERMLAGVATRGFERVADPIGERARAKARCTSKSTVSRRFVTGTKKALDELLARDLSGVDPAVLMIDGADFAGAMCVVALVVTGDGAKVPVGLRLGDTENATVVKALLADLVDRGLNPSGGLLVVIDGAKALDSAVRSVFGDLALIQRCQVHKRRIDRPSGAGKRSQSWVASRLSRRRCRSRSLATRSWRAASSVQPRVWASSRRTAMSASCSSRTSIRSGSGTKLLHCSQMLA